MVSRCSYNSSCHSMRCLPGTSEKFFCHYQRYMYITRDTPEAASFSTHFSFHSWIIFLVNFTLLAVTVMLLLAASNVACMKLDMHTAECFVSSQRISSISKPGLLFKHNLQFFQTPCPQYIIQVHSYFSTVCCLRKYGIYKPVIDIHVAVFYQDLMYRSIPKGLLTTCTCLVLYMQPTLWAGCSFSF